MSIPNNIILNGVTKGYLSADMNTTQTTLSLYTTDSAWLQLVGLTDFTFYVRVDRELMWVTGATGSLPNLTLTVARNDGAVSGAGASHNRGMQVVHVVNAKSITHLYKQAVNGVIQSAGTQINYIPHGFNISVADDATNNTTNLHFQMPMNNEYGIMRTPLINGWTQLAQADSAALATVDYSYNGISISQTAATSATHRLQALYRSLSAPPLFYQFKLLFSASPGSTAKAGILIRQSSTGKMYCWGHQYGTTALKGWLYSDSNTLTTGPTALCDPGIHHNKMFLGIGPGGTILPTYSADNFKFWNVAADVTGSITGSPVYDQIGFWIDTPSGQFATARLVHAYAGSGA